jgi:hypothetical protein
MAEIDKSSIGLAEFIQQVKEDLLSVAPGKDTEAPFLFVESVELELQVTVKRTAKGSGKDSVKISVLGTGGEIGAEVGGDRSRDEVHKVKVKQAARDFTESFYRSLGQKNSLAIAVSSGKSAIFK